MSSHTGFTPKSVMSPSTNESSISQVPKHGTETVEQLREILRSKESELESLKKKAAEYQARLDRVAAALKADDNK
ncbi:hypothetical protein BWQ96_08877 [Gracilariopsis chorda]|uniref:Uncharacterized protein n=1 Tax=Gracilariopsis chorda TaxID=448386 RepID=A0A2V3IH32_9FLOR|nr:hypothetical protein BWQ96_08877 [Gracilariopsis chorda]|eukprot:PXF41379.1 hypothetical protein BWQ96_08877 [Gracilariopsis chorda]